MRIPFPWWLPVGRVPEISPQELKRLLETGRSLQVVDARTELEFRQGTIGQAQHAPLTGMPDSLARLDLDAGSPVVLLCLSGHRSRPGTRWLRDRGIQAYSLKGGVLAWKQAGYPLDSPPQ